MKFPKLLLCSTLLFSSSVFAHDITLHNNSDYYLTGRIGQSVCSSAYGGRGVINPHGSISIPQIAKRMYCRNGCEVQLYLSKDCSGEKLADAHIDYYSGVDAITNYSNAEHAKLTGGGDELTVVQESKVRGWLRYLGFSK